MVEPSGVGGEVSQSEVGVLDCIFGSCSARGPVVCREVPICGFQGSFMGGRIRGWAVVVEELGD